MDPPRACLTSSWEMPQLFAMYSSKAIERWYWCFSQWWRWTQWVLPSFPWLLARRLPASACLWVPFGRLHRQAVWGWAICCFLAKTWSLTKLIPTWNAHFSEQKPADEVYRLRIFATGLCCWRIQALRALRFRLRRSKPASFWHWMKGWLQVLGDLEGRLVDVKEAIQIVWNFIFAVEGYLLGIVGVEGIGHQKHSDIDLGLMGTNVMLEFLPLLFDVEMFSYALEGTWKPLEKFAEEWHLYDITNNLN